MPTFPSGSFDEPGEFLALLSDYWTRWYQGSGSLQKFCEALARLWSSPAALFQVAIDRTSWDHIPLFEEMECFPILLREDQINTTTVSLDTWDNTDQTFDGGLSFDTPSSQTVFYHPLPAGLVGCSLLTNAITSPDKSWSAGIDFGVEGRQARFSFHKNPFTEPGWLPIETFDEAGQSSRQLVLWGWKVRWDVRWLQLLLGEVIGVEAPSSEAYRELLLGAMRSTTCGTSAADVRRMVSATVGIPLAEAAETVQAVGTDRHGTFLATETRIYRIPSSAALTVGVGDVLQEGQAICTALRIDDLHRGQLPPGLAALSIGEELLPWKDGGPLSFDNKTVPVTETLTAAGPRVEFPLGGFPEQVARFWDTVHERGVASGRLLSSYLDPLQRNPAPAGSSPATVNPLQFLVENLLRGPVAVCQLQLDQLTTEQSSSRLAWLAALADTLPPWGKFFIVLVVTFSRDRVNPANEDPAAGPRIREWSELIEELAGAGESINPETAVRESFQFVTTEQGCDS
jgi:hypothetical protein